MNAPAIVIADTALGFAGVALNERGICRATLFHRTLAACRAELIASGAEERDDPRAAEVRSLLERYAAGEPVTLDDYPVDLQGGTELQRATLLGLRDIPMGETRSYGWLAAHVGAPGKARVIGSINGANPIPLWLPCHRVIAANGDLQGYGGGLAMKRTLLELEGALSKPLALA